MEIWVWSSEESFGGDADVCVICVAENLQGGGVDGEEGRGSRNLLLGYGEVSEVPGRGGQSRRKTVCCVREA